MSYRNDDDDKETLPSFLRSQTERTNAKFALTADGVGDGEGAAVVVVRLPARPPARPIGERAREGRFGEIGGFGGAEERATWAKSRDGYPPPSSPVRPWGKQTTTIRLRKNCSSNGQSAMVSNRHTNRKFLQRQHLTMQAEITPLKHASAHFIFYRSSLKASWLPPCLGVATTIRIGEKRSADEDGGRREGGRKEGRPPRPSRKGKKSEGKKGIHGLIKDKGGQGIKPRMLRKACGIADTEVGLLFMMSYKIKWSRK